jgi:hypothetical protein
MLDVKQRHRAQELHDTAVALSAKCAHDDHGLVGTRMLVRAGAYDPVHPGWPAGAPDDQGGEFRPKDPNHLALEDIPKDSPKRPVPFVDSSGAPVLDDVGNPILRPADLPPELFVQRGLEFAQTWAGTEDFPEVHNSQAIYEMSSFGQGHALDAQRINGRSVREYRDYATIAIGLHDAAAGIPIEDSLKNQNAYAGLFSRFDEPMDAVYGNLPIRNVRNTEIGYQLYQTGRITPPQR